MRKKHWISRLADKKSQRRPVAPAPQVGVEIFVSIGDDDNLHITSLVWPTKIYPVGDVKSNQTYSDGNRRINVVVYNMYIPPETVIAILRDIKFDD